MCTHGSGDWECASGIHSLVCTCWASAVRKDAPQTAPEEGGEEGKGEGRGGEAKEKEEEERIRPS